MVTQGSLRTGNSHENEAGQGEDPQGRELRVEVFVGDVQYV